MSPKRTFWLTQHSDWFFFTLLTEQCKLCRLPFSLSKRRSSQERMRRVSFTKEQACCLHKSTCSAGLGPNTWMEAPSVSHVALEGSSVARVVIWSPELNCSYVLPFYFSDHPRASSSCLLGRLFISAEEYYYHFLPSCTHGFWSFPTLRLSEKSAMYQNSDSRNILEEHFSGFLDWKNKWHAIFCYWWENVKELACTSLFDWVHIANTYFLCIP